MGVGGHCHTPAGLSPGNTRYPLCRRLGGHQSQPGQMQKFHPHWDSIPGPSSLQQVAVLHVTKSNGDEGTVVDSAFQ